MRDSTILERLRVRGDGRPLMPAAATGRGKEPFVRIPLAWLYEAAKLPGRACHVGLALHYLCGVKKASTVRLSMELCKDLGLDRFAVYRALNQLEAAGLVRVVRAPGRLPVVTVVPRGMMEDG